MTRQTYNSNLSRKATTLKRAAKGSARDALNYVPGINTALTIQGTVRSTRKTLRAADSYLNALSKDVKRRIGKYI